MGRELRGQNDLRWLDVWCRRCRCGDGEHGAGQQVAVRDQELQQVGGFSPGVRGQLPEAVRLGTPCRVLCDARFRDRSPDPGRTGESPTEPQAWDRCSIRAMTWAHSDEAERHTLRLKEPRWTCGHEEEATAQLLELTCTRDEFNVHICPRNILK